MLRQNRILSMTLSFICWLKAIAPSFLYQTEMYYCIVILLYGSYKWLAISYLGKLSLALCLATTCKLDPRGRLVGGISRLWIKNLYLLLCSIIGCPLYLTDLEVGEKLDSLSKQEREFLCLLLFHALNWFYEVSVAIREPYYVPIMPQFSETFPASQCLANLPVRKKRHCLWGRKTTLFAIVRVQMGVD